MALLESYWASVLKVPRKMLACQSPWAQRAGWWIGERPNEGVERLEETSVATFHSFWPEWSVHITVLWVTSGFRGVLLFINDSSSPSTLVNCIEVNLWGADFHGSNGNYFLPFPQGWLGHKSEVFGLWPVPIMISGSWNEKRGPIRKVRRTEVLLCPLWPPPPPHLLPQRL